MTNRAAADQITCTIGKCQCGGIVFAAVNEEKHRKDTAKDVAKLIRLGFSITTITLEEVRMGKWCLKSEEYMRG